MLNLNEENALVVSEGKKGIFTSDNQVIRNFGENADVIHTGNKVRIYDDSRTGEYEDGHEFLYGKNSQFIVTGKETSVEEISSHSLALATGDKAKLFGAYVTSNSEDDNERNMVEDSLFITTGEDAFIGICAEKSLAIATGKNSNINELTQTSIGITTADNSHVVSEGPLKKAIILGNDSSIESFEARESTGFVGGKEATALLGHYSSILSEYPLNSVAIGKDGVIVVGWHDGKRKRYSVYYEGEDFETFPEGIKEQPDYNNVSYPINYFKTTEDGQLLKTHTVQGVWYGDLPNNN